MSTQRGKRHDTAEAIECLVVHETDGQRGPFEQWVVASELRRLLALSKELFGWIEEAIDAGSFQQNRDFIPVPDECRAILPDYHLGLDMVLAAVRNCGKLAADTLSVVGTTKGLEGPLLLGTGMPSFRTAGRCRWAS